MVHFVIYGPVEDIITELEFGREGQERQIYRMMCQDTGKPKAMSETWHGYLGKGLQFIDLIHIFGKPVFCCKLCSYGLRPESNFVSSHLSCANLKNQ